MVPPLFRVEVFGVGLQRRWLRAARRGGQLPRGLDRHAELRRTDLVVETDAGAHADRELGERLADEANAGFGGGGAPPPPPGVAPAGAGPRGRGPRLRGSPPAPRSGAPGPRSPPPGNTPPPPGGRAPVTPRPQA